MEEFLRVLASRRRRIRLHRIADTALRGAFYAATAGALVTAAIRFAGLTLPLAVGGAALATIPLAFALREAVRAFSLRDCAIQLDRVLGLEERLSTALETPGAMGELLLTDAAGALSRAPMPRVRLPREASLFAGAALLLTVLIAIPSPERSGARGDAALEAVLATETVKLQSLAGVDVTFKEIAELAAQGRPEEALAALEALREQLERRLLEAAGTQAAALQRQLDQAASSAAAISAELARLGRTVHAPLPRVAGEKLARQKALAAAAAASDDPSVALRAAQLDRADWTPRYDPVIRRYFGREP